MTALDFTAELTPEGQISVPPELAARVPPGEKFQVCIYWGPDDEDADWKADAGRSFAAAYHPDDSVYEVLAEAHLVKDKPDR